MTVLEPKPTKQDLRVLRAVMSDIGDERTIWQIGEALETTDLNDLEATLNGFDHLGYVSFTLHHGRKRVVWWRTPKGDEAVAGTSTRKQAA